MDVGLRLLPNVEDPASVGRDGESPGRCLTTRPARLDSFPLPTDFAVRPALKQPGNISFLRSSPMRPIPDRGQHLTRFYGAYANRIRKALFKDGSQNPSYRSPPQPEPYPASPATPASRVSWARLLPSPRSVRRRRLSRPAQPVPEPLLRQQFRAGYNPLRCFFRDPYQGDPVPELHERVESRPGEKQRQDISISPVRRQFKQPVPDFWSRSSVEKYALLSRALKVVQAATKPTTVENGRPTSIESAARCGRKSPIPCFGGRIGR